MISRHPAQLLIRHSPYVNFFNQIHYFSSKSSVVLIRMRGTFPKLFSSYWLFVYSLKQIIYFSYQAITHVSSQIEWIVPEPLLQSELAVDYLRQIHYFSYHSGKICLFNQDIMIMLLPLGLVNSTCLFRKLLALHEMVQGPWLI